MVSGYPQNNYNHNRSTSPISDPNHHYTSLPVSNAEHLHLMIGYFPTKYQPNWASKTLTSLVPSALAGDGWTPTIQNQDEAESAL